MKRIVLTLYLIILTILSFGQSQGISYQAILIDENPQQIPGLNIEGNVLVNHPLKVRFTILDAVQTIDYQEEHSTSTDGGGMISLVIGTGIPTASSPFTFTEIDWDGTPKYLKVDISTSETEVFYVDFSYQLLTFVPYAYHKNITATGTLRVDDKSTLQDLTVEKTTNLEGNVAVNNRSKTALSGTLTVDESATLKSTLDVAQASIFKGQVTIDADVNGDQANVGSYPLRVRGSNQGIAITVDGSRDNQTNFMVFMDQQGVQGRIEGESIQEIISDPWYYFENAKLLVETGVAGSNLAAALSASTVCAGLGACVTAPPPSKIIFGIAQVVVRFAQVVAYNVFRHTNAGIVYKSKGADYAEFIPKKNPSERFLPGDIVGIKGGFVTRSTRDAEKVMVVSRRPIVLGNMPKEGEESNYERIAFIGQVEVRVIGPVNAGDFIIPTGRGDGVGVAVSPDEITLEQLLQVAGVAWSDIQSEGIGYVNLAVGLSSNDAARLSLKQELRIKEQETEISSLKQQITQMNKVLAQLLPSYADLTGYDASNENSIDPLCSSSNDKLTADDADKIDTEPYLPGEYTVVYYTPTREQILEGIEMAKDILQQQSKGSEPNPLMQKLNTDTNFKESFVDEILTLAQKEIDKNYQRDIKRGINAEKY